MYSALTLNQRTIPIDNYLQKIVHTGIKASLRIKHPHTFAQLAREAVPSQTKAGNENRFLSLNAVNPKQGLTDTEPKSVKSFLNKTGNWFSQIGKSANLNELKNFGRLLNRRPDPLLSPIDTQGSKVTQFRTHQLGHKSLPSVTSDYSKKAGRNEKYSFFPDSIPILKKMTNKLRPRDSIRMGTNPHEKSTSILTDRSVSGSGILASPIDITKKSVIAINTKQASLEQLGKSPMNPGSKLKETPPTWYLEKGIPESAFTRCHGNTTINCCRPGLSESRDYMESIRQSRNHGLMSSIMQLIMKKTSPEFSGPPKKAITAFVTPRLHQGQKTEKYASIIGKDHPAIEMFSNKGAETHASTVDKREGLKKLIKVMNNNNQRTQNITIDLNLPGVANAESFVSELQSIIDTMS